MEVIFYNKVPGVIVAILVIFLFESPTVLASHPCSSCYSFHGTLKNWFRSRGVCMAKGGDLVSMETKDEWDFIKAQIQKRKTDVRGYNEWWIGLWIPEKGNDRRNRPFVWLTKVNLTYNPWQPRKPDKSKPKKFYALITQKYSFQGSFNNEIEERQRGQICEYKTGCDKVGRVRRCAQTTSSTTSVPPSTKASITTSAVTKFFTQTCTTHRHKETFPSTKQRGEAHTSQVTTHFTDSTTKWGVTVASAAQTSSASLTLIVILVILALACIVLVGLIFRWKYNKKCKTKKKTSLSKNTAVPITVHPRTPSNTDTHGADFLDSNERVDMVVDSDGHASFAYAVIHNNTPKHDVDAVDAQTHTYYCASTIDAQPFTEVSYESINDTFKHSGTSFATIGSCQDSGYASVANAGASGYASVANADASLAGKRQATRNYNRMGSLEEVNVPKYDTQHSRSPLNKTSRSSESSGRGGISSTENKEPVYAKVRKHSHSQRSGDENAYDLPDRERPQALLWKTTGNPPHCNPYARTYVNKLDGVLGCDDDFERKFSQHGNSNPQLAASWPELPVECLAAPEKPKPERSPYARVLIGEAPRLIPGAAISSKNQPIDVSLDPGDTKGEEYLYAVVDKNRKKQTTDDAQYAELDLATSSSMLPQGYEATQYAEIKFK